MRRHPSKPWRAVEPLAGFERPVRDLDRPVLLVV